MTREAIDKFGMVRPGERWLVALSGGKDSYGLLALLLDLKWRGLLPVELLACNLDQGQPNFPKHILPEYLTAHRHRRTASSTRTPIRSSPTSCRQGATYCSLCSRLRRGHLYRIAREEGCSALVLGHHREDSLETFFMNLFHGGKLAAMPPRAAQRRGRRRGAAAADLLRRAGPRAASPKPWRSRSSPATSAARRRGCERNAMKAMLDDIEKRMPGRKDVMIRALGNVRPSHLLDPKLFDFARPAATEGPPALMTLDRCIDRRWPTSCAMRPRPKSCRASGGSTGMVRQKTEAIDLVTEADSEAER